MNKVSKYVNALFLAAAALAWLLSSHYLSVSIGYFQLARKMGTATDILQHVLPLLVAIGVFVGLRRNHTALEFTTDSISELTKVSWPTQKEVRLGTIVVIITVILAGLILGVVDLAFVSVIRAILAS